MIKQFQTETITDSTDHYSMCQGVTGEAGEAGVLATVLALYENSTVHTYLEAPQTQGLNDHHFILPIAQRLLVVDLIAVVTLLVDAEEVLE
jgi:hypothetical protein